MKFISSTSDNKFLMTSSLYETIIWDLEANMQKHRLFLGKKIAIKIVSLKKEANLVFVQLKLMDNRLMSSDDVIGVLHSF